MIIPIILGLAAAGGVGTAVVMSRKKSTAETPTTQPQPEPQTQAQPQVQSNSIESLSGGTAEMTLEEQKLFAARLIYSDKRSYAYRLKDTLLITDPALREQTRNKLSDINRRDIAAKPATPTTGKKMGRPGTSVTASTLHGEWEFGDEYGTDAFGDEWGC